MGAVEPKVAFLQMYKSSLNVLYNGGSLWCRHQAWQIGRWALLDRLILQADWYQVPTTLEHTSVARELVNKEQNGFFFYCCPAAGSKRPL